MIIDFFGRNGGGGSGSGSTTDNTMRASGYTQSELSGNSLVFKNLNGDIRNEISLSGITPDLSNYYTKAEVDGMESADTQSISNLQTAVSGNTDNISSLQTQVSANTQAIAALSANTGDATVLEAKSSLPVSGEAGTVIALNKAASYEWTGFTSSVTEKWLKIKGICEENTWINVCFVNNTWVRMGSYNETDGWLFMGVYAFDGWNITMDGNNFTGDNGNGITVSGTTDGTTWEIDFNTLVKGVEADWGYPDHTEIYIETPQEISIYQANSGGTYSNEINLTASAAKKLVKETDPYKEFNAGDFVISDRDGTLRAYMKTGAGTLDGDREIVAWQGNVDELGQKVNVLAKAPKYLKGYNGSPSEVIGDTYAARDGGIRQIVSSATTSGWVSCFLTYESQEVDNLMTIKYLSGITHIDVAITYNGEEASMRIQDLDGFDVNEWFCGWTIISSGTNYYEMSKDFNGETVTFEAQPDSSGDYILISFDKAVSIRFGAWDSNQIGNEYAFYVVDKLVEANAVMSQDVFKIVKMSAADYALITPDSSTLYIII